MQEPHPAHEACLVRAERAAGIPGTAEADGGDRRAVPEPVPGPGPRSVRAYVRAKPIAARPRKRRGTRWRRPASSVDASLVSWRSWKNKAAPSFQVDGGIHFSNALKARVRAKPFL